MYQKKCGSGIGYFMLLLLLFCGGCGGLQPSAGEGISEWQMAAKQAYDREDWVVAETFYQKLRTVRSHDGELWFRLGTIYAHTGRFDEALAAYQKALTLRPDHEDAWHNLSVIHLRQAIYALVQLQHLSKGETDERHVRLTIQAITELLATLAHRQGASLESVDDNNH